jgi:hypothetical protein
MPSKWITDGGLSKDFSSARNVGADIAALKIYILVCIKGVRTTKNRLLDFGGQNRVIVDGARLEAKLTYDDIAESCGLSRKLISEGISKLSGRGIVAKSGTTRKVSYVVVQCAASRWAKLPVREFYKGERLPALTALKNRYEYERSALKLFVYLLSIRKNAEKYVTVSKGTIERQTGISAGDVNEAIKFMLALGLLENFFPHGQVANHAIISASAELDEYHVAGHQWFIQDTKGNV